MISTSDTTNYCKCHDCKYSDSHTTYGHICKTCKKNGHGKYECGNNELINNLKQFWLNVLPEQSFCPIENCNTYFLHTKESHMTNETLADIKERKLKKNNGDMYKDRANLMFGNYQGQIYIVHTLQPELLLYLWRNSVKDKIYLNIFYNSTQEKIDAFNKKMKNYKQINNYDQ